MSNQTVAPTGWRQHLEQSASVRTMPRRQARSSVVGRSSIVGSLVAASVASALKRIEEEEQEKHQLGLNDDPVHQAALHDPDGMDERKVDSGTHPLVSALVRMCSRVNPAASDTCACRSASSSRASALADGSMSGTGMAPEDDLTMGAADRRSSQSRGHHLLPPRCSASGKSWCRQHRGGYCCVCAEGT